MKTKTPRLLPFARHDASPLIERGQEGVAILYRSRPGGERWLFGCCRASRATAKALRDTLLHNVTIACTWPPAFASLSFPAVGSRVVFPEDVREESGTMVAFFNLELGACGLPSSVKRGFVVAAFHTFLSDVVELEAR